ncbi:unnamed protein product, partial [Nesidiocoris tenuis]
MSTERTSLVIKTGPGTGPAGSGPSRPAAKDQVPVGGEHVVRIRLGGGSGGGEIEGGADLDMGSGERTPVAIRSPDAADGRRSCTVVIAAPPRTSKVAVAGSRQSDFEPPSGKKSVTVYLQPWTSTPVRAPAETDVSGKSESGGTTMLIKPEEEPELFYRSSGGSASSTTGSEAADSGTCSDLDNTSPRPADWRRPRRAASDEDISSATDSLSDHDHDHEHDRDDQTSPFNDSKKSKSHRSPARPPDKDDYLVFHLNEKDFDKCPSRISEEQTTFAGRRSLEGESATIRSARGTIRGVKNRVRAGIATFLSINTTKNRSHQSCCHCCSADCGKRIVHKNLCTVLSAPEKNGIIM